MNVPCGRLWWISVFSGLFIAISSLLQVSKSLKGFSMRANINIAFPREPDLLGLLEKYPSNRCCKFLLAVLCRHLLLWAAEHQEE